MKSFKIHVFIIVFGLVLQGCGLKTITKTGVKPQNRTEQVSALSWYDVESDSAKYVVLSEELKEISGLCFTVDGRLFTHGDDDGDVFQIDPVSGKIIKTFYVGNGEEKGLNSIKGDFEDIAIVGDRFFLTSSKGKIYEFKEGKQGEHVEFTIYKTKLTKDNNIEGLCYDPETNSLLLACKDYPGENYDKSKTVYSFGLSAMSLVDSARFVLPVNKLKANTIEGEFRPSGIARHPVTGTFFIIASHGKTIVEITKDGFVLNQRDLPASIHLQPEGIAFSKDNTLYISDEANTGQPHLTSYKMIKK